MRLLIAALVCSPGFAMAGTTEFCLDGQLDLGLRYQGSRPEAGEFYSTRWCVISEDDSDRVIFSGAGKANPDMDDIWTIAYESPDTVRIVNKDAPPDILFLGTDSADEAQRVRRIDPRRFLEEMEVSQAAPDGVQVGVTAEGITAVSTWADLPLRGRVPVVWQWDWSNEMQPNLQLLLDGELLFSATGAWRDLGDDEAEDLWQASPGADPVEVPGERWPAAIDLRLINLTDDVYLVRGVRTGFQHLVVTVEEGLVVADAPAGWVEFHHIPPADLVPGLGISGLSEKFIDFLKQEFPGRPIKAVALTHFHDDHAGGARAFAAEGAQIYAPADVASFLERALNSSSKPRDRLGDRELKVLPVESLTGIGEGASRVELLSMGSGPHGDAMLGVLVPERRYFFVSDVHVPRDETDEPRAAKAVTECWFAAWATRNLASDVKVANSHSAPLTTISRLQKYLESDLCKNQ